MKIRQDGKKLARNMGIALLLGLISGCFFLFLREFLTTNGNHQTWNTIYAILFQDISAENANQAIGLFYIVGQLFVNALQLIIVPMVFISIIKAISTITDTKAFGRISSKTIQTFVITTVCALIWAAFVGFVVYKGGFFQNVQVEGLNIQEGATGANPLNIIVNIIPNNIFSAFTQNSNVLAIVFVAVSIGLAVHSLKEKIEIFHKIINELDVIVTTCLSFVITKFAPFAIFCLLSRTFAMYGIQHLKPAIAYLVSVFVALFVYLVIAYPIYIAAMAKLNPKPFMRKMCKVALFGFSTSSSAATLPLNKKTVVEELGVKEEIASFTLPLGMTINMDGTAIMQVIAALFIAVSSGYEITFSSMAIIALLALIASVGTPAAPGAGAVILFTILTGMGYTNESALLAYSLILAINRPVEMLVSSLNIVGDASTSVIVAKKENKMNETVYFN